MPNIYGACSHIKKHKPDMTVNKEIADAIGSGYRVLPMFEKGLYEHTYKEYYSLNNNEYLNCRWKEYVSHYGSKVFTPYQFIDTRDYHFCNGSTMLLPSASLHNITDFRLKMKSGPGVDFRGELPIPEEMIMKRGLKMSQRPEPLLKRKGKNMGVQVG